jgi:hypothetical protein
MNKPHRKVYGPTGVQHGSEERKLKKYIGKRISEADHELLKRYAASLNVDVAALLTPHVDSLLAKARQHQSESTLESARS